MRRRLAEERELELIVGTYPGAGFYSLQRPESFEALLRFPFHFRPGSSSFDGGVGEPGTLGSRPDGLPYRRVCEAEHDDVLARLAELLDGREEQALRKSVALAGSSR